MTHIAQYEQTNCIQKNFLQYFTKLYSKILLVVSDIVINFTAHIACGVRYGLVGGMQLSPWHLALANTYWKSVYPTLVLDGSKSGSFIIWVKDETTVDAFGYDSIVRVWDILLLSYHTAWGSALLVLLRWAHARASIRGTSNWYRLSRFFCI